MISSNGQITGGRAISPCCESRFFMAAQQGFTFSYKKSKILPIKQELSGNINVKIGKIEYIRGDKLCRWIFVHIWVARFNGQGRLAN